MSDDDVRVSLARLDGRLDTIIGRLDRAETACERRAQGHVDRELYASERATFREEINGLGKRITTIERDIDRRMTALAADIAETRREDARTRRWLISTVVTIVLGTATVLMGVLV